MKKITAIVLTLVILCSGITFALTSCSETVDVESLLEYEQGSPAYSLELGVGEYSYGFKVSLGANTGEYAVRDGQALASGGVIDSIMFEMQDGELKMKSGDFECVLGEKDSPALYALFGGFAIEPSEFIGITEDTNGILTARFGGKYKYVLSIDKETRRPREIKVNAGGEEYKITFKDE